MKKLLAADLFAGAGGTSTGLIQACRASGLALDLVAVNHWRPAVETHSANYPDARHLCESLDSVDPRKVFPGQKIDMLVASPECQGHSNARGGKPSTDQARATAWHVLRWAEALRPDSILVENVREFKQWGPLGDDGRPIKTQRGVLYRRWLSCLRALGYEVRDRELTASNYGDATSRTRLFIQARRKRCSWPLATHADSQNIFGLAPWRPASEIIDWSLSGKSIFRREKALADNTLRRIEAGLKRFGGDSFLVQYNTERKREAARVLSVGDPLGTLTTENRFALCRPFLVEYYGNGGPQSVDEPLNTVPTRDRFALVTPGLLDITLRMLQPSELAAAHSFPPDYHFAGNRGDIVRQIGNSVPVRLAQALCGSILDSMERQAPKSEAEEVVAA